MPCYRCGARQSDPARGPSDWRRGVARGTQVLVCPDCQSSHDWRADLDRCASCGSTVLVRQLGETRCKDCGAATSSPAADAPADASLGAEVDAALRRRFGR